VLPTENLAVQATDPPFCTVRLPLPSGPVRRLPVVSPLPVPVTVAVPVEPELLPMNTKTLFVTVPPFWTVRLPLPFRPAKM
jgi:hypothetical protein